jgi:hypothetical protein
MPWSGEKSLAPAGTRTPTVQLVARGYIDCVIHIAMRVSYYRRGFGLNVGLIDKFNTQLIITFNSNAIVNLHNLHITAPPAKHFPGCCLHKPFPDSGF